MNFRALITLIVDSIFPKKRLPGRDWSAMTADIFEHSVARASYDEVLSKAHALALFSYNDPLMKEAVHALKYNGERRVATILADLLARHIMEEVDGDAMLASGKLLTLPIPVSFGRHVERGYNQTELLAESVAHKLSTYLEYAPNVLVRARFDGSQTLAPTRRERALNIRGAFRVTDADRIKGRDVLLIDDVITTSATISEAAATLHAAGARSVFAIAAAH